MTTTTRNEAAERLLTQWSKYQPDDSYDAYVQDVRDALAAERRATVERIRERIQGPEGAHRSDRRWVLAILDEETTR